MLHFSASAFTFSVISRYLINVLEMYQTPKNTNQETVMICNLFSSKSNSMWGLTVTVMSARVKPDCQLKPNCQNCQLPIELSNWDVNDEVTRLSIETKLSELPIETRWSKETKLLIVCQRFEFSPRSFCERAYQLCINIIVFYPIVNQRVT